MKKFLLGLLLLGLLAWVPVAHADGVCEPPGVYCLATWGFNFNGSLQADNWPNTPGDPPPGWAANYSGFDFTTGFGTINFNYNGSPGSNFFSAFLDHDIGPFPLDSNTGSANGSPTAGLSWQIGPPGYSGEEEVGDTFPMFLANTLNNQNEIEPGEYADVSAALGWGFSLNTGEGATITFAVSPTAPTSGFYLSEFDAVTGSQLYFSSDLSVTNSNVIPEPGTLLLLGSGLLAAVGAIRRRRSS